MARGEGSEDVSTIGLLTKWLLLVLGFATAAAGVWRIVAQSDSITARLDSTTLTYFGVAGVLLLLRDVRSLAFGNWKVEFERARQAAADAKAAANDAKVAAENAQAEALGAAARSKRTLAKPGVAEPQPGTAPDDPWKGVFGGEAIANSRRIDASVEPLGIDGEIFTVRLRVTSTDPAKPLRDAVQFFLHPTFTNDRPIVTVGPSGAAELVLRAWGAFTVGVLADNGDTKLELDLAELQYAPRAFRER